MKVRGLRDHTDETGGVRKLGAVYDTLPHRAFEMAASGAVELLESLNKVGWWHGDGRMLSPLMASLYAPVPFDAGARPRVAQFTRYDPGSAAYRYHSAYNSVPGGVSAFVRYGHENPYCDLRQYDGDRHRVDVVKLFEEADVVLAHMDFSTLDNDVRRWPDRKRQLLVRHYHGSQAGNFEQGCFIQNQIDEDLGVLQIGARLYHNRFSKAMQWVPIPVPFDDYAALRAKHFVPLEQREQKNVRIAHSPTHPRIKGTVVLETMVQDLQFKGVPVELVMIRGQKHGDALAMKASCDITFDSFWLGIQGSGLESACMGQPVVAGDPEVRDEYIEHIGYCPYTFTQGALSLKETLEELIFDTAHREREAAKVAAYVREWHDYPAVGARFWSIMHAALAERQLVAA